MEDTGEGEMFSVSVLFVRPMGYPGGNPERSGQEQRAGDW